MTYDFTDYARFLPEDIRARATRAPESDWWQWRGRRVHIARARHSASPVRVWVIHGGGGYSHALWPVAALVAGHGIDLAAPDLPLYGFTEEPDPGGVRYADWIDLLVDLVAAEDDGRPLYVVGASMGGMLGYELAARTGGVAALVATCLLDPQDPQARRAAARFSWSGGPAPRMLRIAAAAAGRVRVPIAWAVDMNAMSHNAELSRLCATDPRGGGVRVPIGWMADFFQYRHTPPEDFASTPVVLAHPAADTWTPPEVSIRFARRITAPTRITLLENCGHYPIEQPGLGQLESIMLELLDSVSEAGT